MARKTKPQESCAFDFDRVEVWGPELKRVFKDAMPKRLKRIFAAEPPDDMEHAREILLAHMSIERGEVAERVRQWLDVRRVAAYYGERGDGGARSELSLSRAPFEQFFDAYVPRSVGGEPRIVRVEFDGADVLSGEGEHIDGLPNVGRAILDAWAYWLADPEFLPADECLFIGLK